MAGLNNIREAYQQVYAQLDERIDPEERALRRAEIADKKASRMDAKVAAKYAGSEARSAEREDKKSKGKHIHGMADSVELEGELVDEGKVELKQRNKNEMQRKAGNAAREALSSRGKKKTSSMDRMTKLVKAIGRDDEEKRWKKMGEDPRHNTNYNEETDLEEKKGLWDNIHAKRKRGERPAKPGEKGYPKTLNIEELDQIIEGIRQARKNVGASKCWTGKKLGNPSTKMKGGKEVPNCVPEEHQVDEESYMDYAKRKAAEKKDKRMTVTAADRTGNTKAWQKYKAGDPSYKAASHVGEETLLERPLDTAETGEKERLVKGMKKSATDFKKRYGKRWKNVMYATATKKAKEHMDTSKSDRRYAVEETSMDESADLENRKKGPRKPSQIQKREKLTRLIDQIRSKKEGESK